eukprot:CAMPEP_0116034648 /NCGR_PEP_ID=MMETSP0321-20121206/19755_1 /TAXON_ID=163516 /ORGANISM="Leptocylindrus danicus var. danicus, Strain B650" /LENGTH=156 /DNA_ID=CAMNT_0003511045 /DNA_START=454 /DNA_END=924 /DNA_ORIENTATION=+
MAAPKKRPTLAKRFKCPFCANDDVVECKMDTKGGIGSLACRLCGASYQMPIHHLHEPIDVFSEWLDDCEAAEKANGTHAAAASSGGHLHEEDDDDEEDDLLRSGGGSGLRRRGTGSDENKKRAAVSGSGGVYDDEEDGLGVGNGDHSDDDEDDDSD